MKKVLLAAVVAVLFMACDTFSGKSVTEPDVVLTEGRCNQVGENVALGTATIICADSTSVVGGSIGIHSIQWRVRSTLGNVLDSQTEAPLAEVTFPAIACAEEVVTVEQTPVMENGSLEATRSHSVPLVCSF